MTKRTGRGKGQVFSIDVLFSLLPVAIILGASLQYMYLVQEEAKYTSKANQLEVRAQGLADYVASSFQASWNSSNIRDTYDAYVNVSDCRNINNKVNSYNRYLSPLRHNSSTRVLDYYDSPGNESLCDYFDMGGVLSSVNSTGAADERFMLQFDRDEKPMPGRIAGVSFVVWEKP